MNLNRWMDGYQTRKLNQMIMPGAHDAGTAKGHINLTALGTNSNSATQDKTIWQQLNCGTRFFDLRLKSVGKKASKKIVAHHTTGGQGATSTDSFDETIGRVSDWCYTHPTEVVIIRISHTDAGTKADDIVRASVHDRVLNKPAQGGNLCTRTLAEIAREGNLVVVFDEGKGGFKRSIDQTNGIHGFKKYSPGANGNARGIMTCGSYSATHAIKKVITNGLSGQAEHSNYHGAGANCGHLWQLYWQKTYTNPASSTGIETGTRKVMSYGDDGVVHGGTHATIGYMINLMLGSVKVDGAYKWDTKTKTKGFFPGFRKKTVVMHEGMYVSDNAKTMLLPNIISYDFVNEDVNKRIVALNDRGVMV